MIPGTTGATAGSAAAATAVQTLTAATAGPIKMPERMSNQDLKNDLLAVLRLAAFMRE